MLLKLLHRMGTPVFFMLTITVPTQLGRRIAVEQFKMLLTPLTSLVVEW